MASIGLYLMSAKGLGVLERLLDERESSPISFVVSARDPAVQKDYYDEIRDTATSAGIETYERASLPAQLPYASHVLAVSWRWLIHSDAETKLIVFHDALLPRYRGFAPLISALENGDKVLGVTALLAEVEYDTGPIVGRANVEVSYPLRIVDAITLITNCYAELASTVVGEIVEGALSSEKQDEAKATYSLWRDEADYEIEWGWDAGRIRRFVDAVGYPYRGALTYDGKSAIRVISCSAVPGVHIENQAFGKVIFIEGGEPTVVCGSGLLRIHEAVFEGSGESALPLRRFRTRFRSGGGSIHVG